MNGEVSGVPLDLLSWLLALSPIVVLLVLLAVRRWKAPQAGPIGLLVATAVALIVFRTPLENLAVAYGKGVWDAIFILFVVWPALLLYRIGDRAGAFDALRVGIAKFSKNDLFLVLAFGWVFASFLQGIAGFGTPIAVVAPLLLALRVKPVMAVAIPLIGHAWANMFGTLAVGWLATIQVVDLQDATRTAFDSALLLWIPNLAGAFFIAWLFGRGRAMAHAAPMILIISLVHGGGQLVLTLWDPVLSNFLAATAGLLLLYPLSRWKRYSEPVGIESRIAAHKGDEIDDAEEEQAEPVMGLGMALMPYAVLTVASVFALVIGPISDALGQFEIGLGFPTVDTGYGVERAAESPYSPFAPFTHPGMFLLIAALAGWIVYRSKGYFKAWGERADPPRLWTSVVSDAVPASFAIVSFLVLSKVMDHSGQTETLALGIEAVTPPVVYAFFATWIGVLGAFMTSSNTASNVLFSPLQQTVANTQGLSESAIIGAQSAGGAIGNSIAPANVVLGTGTTGSVGQEGQVLRTTLPWALAVTVVTGLATVALTQIA
ncbi:MAG: L-lactate permease [Microthrixaceae bacterium]